jgi:hypothetical protein
MVAVMGNVFALEYNFHVLLYFEGHSVRTHGRLYVTMISEKTIVNKNHKIKSKYSTNR